MLTKLSVYWMLQCMLLASDSVWIQATQEGDKLRTLGQYAAAEPYYTTALRESEEMEPGDRRRAISAEKLAIVYEMRGEYATAERLYKQAITGWQKTPGKIDAEIGLANALTNLATLYHAERKLVEAEPLLDRALVLIGGRQGPDSPDVAVVLHNLATVYALTNRDAAAESMYQRELDIYKRHPGDDLQMTAALNGIAILRVRQIRYPEAEKLFWQVLALRERNLGPSHPDLIKPLSNLGDLLRLQQHNEKAEALFRRALAIAEPALGQTHPDIAIILNNLSIVTRIRGDYPAAETMLTRAISIQEQALGADSPLLAPMRDNLAELCRLQNRKTEAESIFRGTLALLDRIAQPPNESLARTLNNLATLLRDQGRRAEAERLYKRAIDLARQTAALPGPDRAAMMMNYAILLRSTHRRHEAAELDAQASSSLAEYRRRSGAGLVVDIRDLAK